MLRSGPRHRILGLTCLLVLVASSTVAPAAAAVPDHGPPEHVLGLVVAKEDISKTLSQAKRAQYLQGVSLYSFRQTDNLLQATLEVGTFRPGTPSASDTFQASVVTQIGSSVAARIVVDAQPVFITTSKGLVIAIWFRKGSMFALAVRNSYDQPKALLRQVLGVNP